MSALRRRSARSVSWKYAWTIPGRVFLRSRARARSPSEWVVGIASSRAPEGSRDVRGRRQEGPRLAGREVRRSRRTRRAVRVAELRARLGHVGIRVPASPAEQGRREAELPHPPAFPADALARSRPPSAGHGRERSSACGGRAGRGAAAARARSSQAASSSPAPASAGRTQRRHREATRPSLLERREAGPDGVVERSLDVAGDDRVPFPAHRAPTVQPRLRRARVGARRSRGSSPSSSNAATSSPRSSTRATTSRARSSTAGRSGSSRASPPRTHSPSTASS